MGVANELPIDLQVSPVLLLRWVLLEEYFEWSRSLVHLIPVPAGCLFHAQREYSSERNKL